MNTTPGRRVPPQKNPLRALGAASAGSSGGARITHQQIAQRAHAIWKSKGCPTGQDEKNWHEAEAQLKAERGLH